MSADFDSELTRGLTSLSSELGRTPLPGPAAARARGRRRARNQAASAVFGAVAIVAGGVFALAQPAPLSAPDLADQPSGPVSPPVGSATATPVPTDALLPESVLLTVEDIEPDGASVDWGVTDAPTQAWPCFPPVPDSGRALQRHFENPEGGRIHQIVEPTGKVEQAEARLAEIRDELTTCVEDGTAAGDDFRLDQVWSVTGVGDEAVLVRYWAPIRAQTEGLLLLVSVSIARTGEAVTSVARGGFAMDANLPDTSDDAQAAVTRLCAETGGPCIADPDQEQVYPEPAGDVPGWLTIADVSDATGVDRISAASEVTVAPDGTFGFVCFLSDARAAGATTIESRTYHDPLDPAGIDVNEFIARFPAAAEARAHYDVLAAEGDACSAEPTLSVQNTGMIAGEGDMVGTTWRTTAEDTAVTFVYGVVVNGNQVAFVNLNLASASDEDLARVLTLAGERLDDSGTGTQ